MADALRALGDAGVSIWLDDLSRERLTSGELTKLMADEYVSGVTTNPSIFAKAISGGSDAYAGQLADLGSRGVGVGQALQDLTTFDVRLACDMLRDVYDASDGVDGRVSIEVDPRLARNTTATIAEARALWWAVDRPNLFVKIPAARQGLPAITACLAEGISINVTLIFSLTRYAEVIDAFFAGLEGAARAGRDLARIASVASFFVSRVDTEVDARLVKISTPEAAALRGTAAIANARLAYQRYESAFTTERWAALRAAGARPQRPLWASTSTKDPAYPDTRYVVDLVAPASSTRCPKPLCARSPTTASSRWTRSATSTTSPRRSSTGSPHSASTTTTSSPRWRTTGWPGSTPHGPTSPTSSPGSSVEPSPARRRPRAVGDHRRPCPEADPARAVPACRARTPHRFPARGPAGISAACAPMSVTRSAAPSTSRRSTPSFSTSCSQASGWSPATTPPGPRSTCSTRRCARRPAHRVSDRRSVRSWERGALGPGAPSDELRAGRHVGVWLVLRIGATVEAEGGARDPAQQVEDDGPPFVQAPADGDVVPGGGVADVLQRVFVLVGPEVVDVVEGRGRTEHRSRRGGAVVRGAVEVLHPDAAEDRVRVVGDVAGRVDVGRAGPALLVDQDPVLLRDRRSRRSRRIGLDPHAADGEVAADPLPVGGHDPGQPLLPLERGDTVAGQEPHAVRAVDRGDQRADLLTEHPLQRVLRRVDGADLDAELRQGGRHLAANETPCPPRRRGVRGRFRP
jgi:transaldolase